MWECVNCSEQIEDEFDVCWNCQTAKDGSPPEAYFKPKKRVPRELADMQERMSRQTDNDLLRIITVDSKDYRKEAIDLARAELERRGVSAPQPTKPRKKAESQVSKPVNEESEEVANSSNVCSICATPLDEDAKFCPLCASPVTPDGKIDCPNCGKSVSAEGLLFCKYCAAELTPKKKEPSVSPSVSYSPRVPVQSPLRDKAGNLISAGGVTAVISAIAFLWGYSYTSSFANSARAGFMSLAGRTDSTYTFAQLCLTFGAIGFIVGVVLLIVGLSQR